MDLGDEHRSLMTVWGLCFEAGGSECEHSTFSGFCFADVWLSIACAFCQHRAEADAIFCATGFVSLQSLGNHKMLASSIHATSCLRLL
jgi:hypothetical protein